jgi:hypothetical protein
MQTISQVKRGNIFGKIMVHILGAQMRNVCFVKSGFTGLTDFAVVWYSATINGLPGSSQFCFQCIVVIFSLFEKVCAMYVLYMCYMPSPSHTSSFIWPSEQYLVNNVMTLMQLFLTFCYFICFKFTYSVSTIFSDLLDLLCSLSMRGKVSYRYKTTGKIRASYCLSETSLRVYHALSRQANGRKVVFIQQDLWHGDPGSQVYSRI